MIVLLDCDGVLADLTGYICTWLSTVHDIYRTPHQVDRWDYAAALKVDALCVEVVPNLIPVSKVADVLAALGLPC